MTPEALIDALLPGDDVLPSGTAAGVRLDAAAHQPLIDAIARAGDDGDAIRAVERAMPAEFAALLYAVTLEYYDSDVVITALGWTSRPPHPLGHRLPVFDERLLTKVKARAPFWRDPR